MEDSHRDNHNRNDKTADDEDRNEANDPSLPPANDLDAHPPPPTDVAESLPQQRDDVHVLRVVRRHQRRCIRSGPSLADPNKVAELGSSDASDVYEDNEVISEAPEPLFHVYNYQEDIDSTQLFGYYSPNNPRHLRSLIDVIDKTLKNNNQLETLKKTLTSVRTLLIQWCYYFPFLKQIERKKKINNTCDCLIAKINFGAIKEAELNSFIENLRLLKGKPVIEEKPAKRRRGRD